MRIRALLLLALLPTAFGQGMPAEFTDDAYLVRVGEGDIPTTEPEEPAGWNVAEYLRFTSQGGEHRIPLASNRGEIVDAYCACGNASVEGSELIVRDTQAGEHQVRLVRSFPAANGFLVDFALHGGQVGRLIAYVPEGHHVDTGARLDQQLACTARPCTIQQYALEGSTHFAVLPGDAPRADDEDGPLDDALPILLGALAGILLWSFLVQRGYVQRRRRQEVAKAAHVQAAEESKDMLQARKRVLMAGLKDLEMARMNKEVDDATYDRLKSELKRETVTVMRALEQG